VDQSALERVGSVRRKVRGNAEPNSRPHPGTSEAYANSAEIATSAQVRKLMKGRKAKKAEEPAPAE
jgi:hypothetical protein